MDFDKLVSEKSSKIQKRWINATLETYPADSQRFLKNQRDRFANPVGYTLSKEIRSLFDHLLKSSAMEEVAPVLERMIRIRAIQDFSPSRATNFIFLLKRIIREELEQEVREEDLYNALRELETRIDELALLAFDIYMKCREKLYEIRANQAKNQVSGLLRRAGLVCEITAVEPDPKEQESL
jgi:hypothetical protein